MASIIDEFPEFQVSAAITRNTVTNVAGVKTPSWAAVATVNCLFWEGASAETYVSERFRDVTDAVISVDPLTDILKNDKVVVESKTYHVIGIDNVGAAGELMTVALGLFA